MSPRRGFLGVAGAGIAFQAGSAAVDSATIMSALVFSLTGSALAVGAVPAILRFGWLFPQFFIGYLVGREGSAQRYYVIGAFGRTTAIAVLALVLFLGTNVPPQQLGLGVLLIWTAYAFVSGIVAVPYNDIVARAVPSELRSRVLATRFFGGGLLALGVAALADGMIREVAFPVSHAGIFGMAAGLMLLSSIVFVAMGEPPLPADRKVPTGLAAYFREGIAVFRQDRTFRRFVYAQWCGGAVLMAMPFYVIAASQAGFGLERVALLLGAQTAGALVSNLLWGWWGDRLGKLSLMRGIAISRVAPPVAVLLLLLLGTVTDAVVPLFLAIFFVIGALANGLTIAVIGLLMEISPEHARPAYSGYFNAMTAPAFLLPLLAGALVEVSGTPTVFALSLLAAMGQVACLATIGTEQGADVWVNHTRDSPGA